MEISIKFDQDSNNSYPTGGLIIRRGVNRPDNFVIIIDDDRQIEVNADQLKKAIGVL